MEVHIPLRPLCQTIYLEKWLQHFPGVIPLYVQDQTMALLFTITSIRRSMTTAIPFGPAG
jgi:hypothetical protein